MDWVGDLSLKRRTGNVDARALTTKCTALWRGLRQMLRAAYDLYNESFPPFASGEGVWFEDADINLPVVCTRCRTNAANHRADEIARVTISFNLPLVTATYSDGRTPVLLTMGRNDKGYVHILHNGTPVLMDRAAEIILRTFFFPDYPEPVAT